MRPGQNKRMRGRPTNNRRGPNPLTRSYEFERPRRQNTRQRASRRGKISPACERRSYGRRSGCGGKLFATRRTLLPTYRRCAGCTGARAERSAATARRGRGTTWKMTAISAGCRIVSLRLRSGRTLTRSRSKDFNRNRALAERPATVRRETGVRARASGRQRSGRLCAPAGSSGQPISGPRSATRSPLPRPQIATRVIATIDTDATVVRGISGPIAILSRRVKPAADAAAAPGLPSFITASPRTNNADPATGAPSPETLASPPPVATPEVAPAGFESPSEGSAFPARGRRRRLRSPYGFGGANSGEGEQPDATPEIADDTPVRE